MDYKFKTIIDLWPDDSLENIDENQEDEEQSV